MDCAPAVEFALTPACLATGHARARLGAVQGTTSALDPGVRFKVYPFPAS
jgi:hypothetical protein